MSRRALVLAGLLLAGCAETWDKPGAGQRDLDRDAYECEVGIPARTAAMIYAPSASDNGWVTGQMQGQALMNSAAVWGEIARTDRLFAMCLRARGWTKQ